MPLSIYEQNALLRKRLLALVGKTDARSGSSSSGPEFPVIASPDAPKDPAAPVHVVVSINEINDMHGTGPLLKRVFQGRRGVFSIRSRDHWGGAHELGDWQVRISQEGCSRSECFRRILRALGGRNVKTVTCVPFLADELVTSLAVKESFDAKLCVWEMDDQNVAVNGISDALMREFLEKCSLRLATHPELRDAYARKFDLPFYILPAIVPAGLVARQPFPPAYEPRDRKGALLGSFWDQSWFDRLCAALEPCRYHIDWYGQNRSPWLQFPPERLARAGITPLGIVPEDRLAQELRKYPFVIAPCGALDGKEANIGVASLSLPGRILFAAATSHTPVLLVGSERSCGARFLRNFGTGLTVPYEAAAIAAAIDRLSDPQTQAEMRKNAARIAGSLSDRGVVEWLAESIDQGTPADTRFERLFAGYYSEGECPSRGEARCASPAGR